MPFSSIPIRRTEAGRVNEEHEEPLRDVLLADPKRFGYEDITGLPWTEIDFQEDVERACEDILPNLRVRIVAREPVADRRSTRGVTERVLCSGRLGDQTRVAERPRDRVTIPFPILRRST